MFIKGEIESASSFHLPSKVDLVVQEKNEKHNRINAEVKNTFVNFIFEPYEVELYIKMIVL